jgi:hypothetical protein
MTLRANEGLMPCIGLLTFNILTYITQILIFLWKPNKPNSAITVGTMEILVMTSVPTFAVLTKCKLATQRKQSVTWLLNQALT